MSGARRILARLGPPPAAAGAKSRRSAAPFLVIGRHIPFPRPMRAAIDVTAGGLMPPEELAGRKVLFAIAGPLAALILTKPPALFPAVPLFAAAGWRFPDVRLARRMRERDDWIRAALPDALDLLAACALGGMSLDRALRAIAPDVEGPLGDALRETIRALDLGVPRRSAYAVLCDRAPIQEVRTLIRALERAERYGTSVATTLVAQAREVRGRQRAAAEESARSAPVRMLFPLVVCFLPAFVLLTVAPVVLSALRRLRGG